MFRFGTFEIHGFGKGSDRWAARPAPALILAMIFAVMGGGFNEVNAGAHEKIQDLTARPQLKFAPRQGKATLPRHQPQNWVLERRAIGILERLDLTGPAAWAEEVPSGVADAIRNSADKAWSWWNGGADETSSDRPHSVNEALPRSTLMKPINTLPAQPRPPGSEDPYEPINRLIFGMNSGLRGYVLGPFADLYDDHTTPEVRRSVGHFFSNLREPVTIASSAFAGNLTDAGNATARFGINSTLGIIGLFDPATGLGYAHRPHDFEELFCQYDLPSGPYVVLPLLGPATARDAVARLLTVAAYVQVMGTTVYLPYRVSDIAVGYAGVHDKVKHLNATVIDPYAIQRSIYLAGRNENCGKPTML